MIGIFDSGYGGLGIMKEIARILPEYDYIYYGDNARTPYGGRSRQTVAQFTDEAVRFLLDRGARLIIVACFTASALALRDLQGKYLRNEKSPYRDRKILGVIRPVVEAAAACSKRAVGIAGTRATIASGVFGAEFLKENPSLEIVEQACPLLVPLIEEHYHTKPEARRILKSYLRKLKSRGVETLILGCTHYDHMFADFSRIMGRRVKVLNSGTIVAESLRDYLTRHPEISSQLSKGRSRTFFTSDDPVKFAEFGSKFAGMPISSVFTPTL